MDFDHAIIVDRVRGYHKRLFLEAWSSRRDPMQAMSVLTYQQFASLSRDAILHSNQFVTFAI